MASSLITVREARQRVLEVTSALPSEPVEIAAALDRVLAEDVKAASDVPPFPCSAMDGYAVKNASAGSVLAVIGESRAGAPAERELGDGQTIRISTGAAVPAGASAVIRQEDMAVHGEQVLPKAAVRDGENIRFVGEDMRAGTTVLRAGTRLRAAELGAAVAAGAGQVLVAQRPRATILATGDELRAPGEKLGPGEIHNANGPMLVALAARCGATAPPAQRLSDEPTGTESALQAALASSDVVIVSGGVSVGPHDHVKPALSKLGVTERFWGVALQPGKPTWFGSRESTLVFGLPGNPVSAVVTFSLFASHAIAALQGALLEQPPAPEARLSTTVRRNRQREQAIRVRLEHRDGGTVAVPTGPQASHILSSLVGADALAMIPAGHGELEAGARVALEPLVR
jgi:molybdopterin molybdotransferase